MPPRTVDPLSVHRAWIGLVQPDGVVASPAALADAGLAPDPLGNNELDALRALCGLPALPRGERESPEDPQFTVAEPLARLFTDVLGCDPETLVPVASRPDALAHPLARTLTEFQGEHLVPTCALANPNAGAVHAGTPWLALLWQFTRDRDLDRPYGEHSAQHWVASPTAKLERLLRETGVPIGVLANGRELRVVYAPAGEGAGVMSFPLAVLLGPDRELALGALVMLLGRARWYDATPDDALPDARDKKFLPRILSESRRYQNNVSTRLAAQVLDALWTLLQGFHDADEAARGALLGAWLKERPEDLYGGLLAVLLRLIFLLYAEDREQLPATGFYPVNYGVRALYERLRDDAGRHPDTMHLRYGAWARLLATFRLVHRGGGHGDVDLPAREGALFSPDTHPFLEGRAPDSVATQGAALEVPAIPDGVVLRVLDALLRVDREDLSYKTLGVEELGSVYESMMGFSVERCESPSLALRPDDVVVDLSALRAVPAKERAAWLDARAGAKVTGGALDALRAATTEDALAEALARHRSPRTAGVLTVGSLVLQPTAERRRSGSHYTPRALTGPIVERTLGPVLAALGPAPTAEQLLGLRVCDPAMGSGAFLVAACRALGDRVYAAWQRDGSMPPRVARAREGATQALDDERVVARRLVAQRCLYGVDRNPFAVDLARLSLWLETLAREHPFTFLDHALRCGDSLVGVSRAQLDWFALEVPPTGELQRTFLQGRVAEGVREAVEKRARIRELALSDDTREKRRLLDDAESATRDARAAGDALVACFFAEEKDGARAKRVKALQGALFDTWDLAALRALLAAVAGGLSQRAFHWELEFPEVFARENPGFDAIVGNPPFIGGTMISTTQGSRYLQWITSRTPDSGNRADLVAYFFRRAFELLRRGGTAGLIATNTIAQGDTRVTGLRWICTHGGAILDATRRLPWPGMAAVVVSQIVFGKGVERGRASLDGVTVDRISAWLTPGANDDSPAVLAANAERSYSGVKIYGQGFLFDDTDDKATPVAKKVELERDPRNRARIREYIGGEEINTSATQSADRYVIDFGMMREEEARQWPELFAIVEAKVKPERAKLSDPIGQKNWWQFFRPRTELYEKLATRSRCLVNARHSHHLTFAWQPTNRVVSEACNVFTDDRDGFFAIMQSRVHEVWARFLGSSMKDDLRYSPSDCFETFPFPAEWEGDAGLAEIGARYHAARAAALVARTRELGKEYGLTKLYNDFHDKDCDRAEVVALREMHAAMDRAVLAAYGWREVPTECVFLPDHPEDPESRVRLRWPDAVRDAVLGKLLALNAARAGEESAAREAARAREPARPARKGRAKG